MLSIRICILDSYVNLNQNQSCQFQISSANNKCLLSCQIQNSTVLSTPLSNSSSCSYVNQIQFLFKYNLFLLMAKWLVRTQEQLVPINLFLLSVKRPVRVSPVSLVTCYFVNINQSRNGQVASSHPRTACAYQFVPVIGQAASSHPRTACTYPFDIRRATSSHPRTARAFYFVFASQVTSSCPRTACASYGLLSAK